MAAPFCISEAMLFSLNADMIGFSALADREVHSQV